MTCMFSLITKKNHRRLGHGYSLIFLKRIFAYIRLVLCQYVPNLYSYSPQEQRGGTLT